MSIQCYNPNLVIRNPNGGSPKFTGRKWANLADVEVLCLQGRLKPHLHSWLRKNNIKKPEFMPFGCRKCEACRLSDARDRALRCMDEFSVRSSGCFLTLTYNDEHLPVSGSYNEQHVKQFVIDLRNHLQYHYPGTKITTFGCAEYGEENLRPHFHLLIFGFDFPDKIKWKKRRGHQAFRSELLESLWTKGNSEIGTLTEQSASYVARYVQKKAKKRRLPSHLLPEKAVCISRRPGIGAAYYEKFGSQLHARDSAVTSSGSQIRIPRYYDRILERNDPLRFKDLKLARREKLRQDFFQQTTSRLSDRKKVHQASLKKLKRSL